MTLLGFLWTAIPSVLIGFLAGISLRPRHSRPRVELDETERWL